MTRPVATAGQSLALVRGLVAEAFPHATCALSRGSNGATLDGYAVEVRGLRREDVAAFTDLRTRVLWPALRRARSACCAVAPEYPDLREASA